MQFLRKLDMRGRRLVGKQWAGLLFRVTIYLMFAFLTFGAVGWFLGNQPCSFPYWTGFCDYTTPKGDFVRGKTGWDAIALLVIPAVLAVAGFEFSLAIRSAQNRSELSRQEAQS